MRRIGLSTVDTAPAGKEPAGLGVERTLKGTIVALRTTSAVVAGAAAIAWLAPPMTAGWVLAVVGGLLLWSGFFFWRVRAAGAYRAYIVADAVIVMVLCLGHQRLVPAGVLSASAGTDWVDLLASVAIFTVQFGLSQPAGALIGAAIVGAHGAGRGGFGEADVVLVFQILLAAVIRLLLLRAARAADAALVEEGRQRSAALAEAAVRADERDQQRRLHDTVLATLTMVSTGDIGAGSDALRRRAAADIAVLEAVRARPPAARPSGRTVRLDALLGGAGAGDTLGPDRLDISLDLRPMEVPGDVATTLTHCVREALTNVDRHAGTAGAWVTGGPDGDGVIVTVSDNGVGFDPAAVSPVRRGLRESIIGRLQAAGGTAHVVSAPGAGATIVLRWPDA